MKIKTLKKYIASIILVFVALHVNAQLGFCNGNSGDPIFTEDFGSAPSAVTEHVPLPPPGQTTYTFLGSPPTVFGDGKYTVTNLNYQQWNWFNTNDHTQGDVNGRMLIVNADFVKGEFYRLPITGLCENTTYEFSSWLLNLTPRDLINGGRTPNPCNVSFEIWDNSDTVLLKSGTTGDFLGSLSTESGKWLEFGLVFQTQPGQASVILKMVNNGVGGYGNDVAIDDIVFKSCGDFISVEDSDSNNNITICSSQTPYSTTITAIPDGSVFASHFYQWQESVDGITWVDIMGETNATVSITGLNSTTFFRSKVAESAANLNNSLCNTVSEVFQITVNQAPLIPFIECWETATFSDTTCSWDVTGTQPAQPALECWETAFFNNVTCSWDVSGTQPVQPTLECWETATFNNVSCAWGISGSQPAQPALGCWETAFFNNVTCSWDISGTQPVQPTLECWETATFNDATCSWDVTGSQPLQPTLECWETTTFNNITCVWDVTGTQPVEPVLECWETPTFNDTTCSWDVTGSQPTQPTLECWETATFNNTTCTWDISGTQPGDIYDEDVFLCNGDTIILNANTSIPNPEYLWNTGDISDFIEVDTSGNYTVEITSTTSCDFETRNFNVMDSSLPVIDTIESDGNNIIVETLNSGNFLYSLDGNIFQTNNIFRNVDGGLYTIYVKDQNCPNIDTKQHLHFYIPKFFTPNNDGENDTFDLKGIEYFSSSYISIYDRYGKLLKNSRNSPFSWDGTFTNQPLPSDDYWYVIVIDNQKITGHFTLKR